MRLCLKRYMLVCVVCVCVHWSNFFYLGMDTGSLCLSSLLLHCFFSHVEACNEKRKVSQRRILPLCTNCLFLQNWEGSQSLGLESWLTGKEHLMLLQKTWLWLPAPTWWLKTIYNSSSREPDSLFLNFLGPRHACTTQIHMQAKTHSRTNKSEFKKKQSHIQKQKMSQSFKTQNKIQMLGHMASSHTHCPLPPPQNTLTFALLRNVNNQPTLQILVECLCCLVFMALTCLATS